MSLSTAAESESADYFVCMDSDITFGSAKRDIDADYDRLSALR